MTDFNLVDSFDIDDGSLNDILPETIFILGYEYGSIRREFSIGMDGPWKIHSANLNRLKKFFERKGYDTKVSGMTMNWCVIKVIKFPESHVFESY